MHFGYWPTNTEPHQQKAVPQQRWRFDCLRLNPDKIFGSPIATEVTPLVNF